MKTTERWPPKFYSLIQGRFDVRSCVCNYCTIHVTAQNDVFEKNLPGFDTLVTLQCRTKEQRNSLFRAGYVETNHWNSLSIFTLYIQLQLFLCRMLDPNRLIELVEMNVVIITH